MLLLDRTMVPCVAYLSMAAESIGTHSARAGARGCQTFTLQQLQVVLLQKLLQVYALIVARHSHTSHQMVWQPMLYNCTVMRRHSSTSSQYHAAGLLQ